MSFNYGSVLPVRISGLSKAEDVSGPKDENYAVCVDFHFMDPFVDPVTVCMPFETGKACGPKFNQIRFS